jgi:hypothetical protein
MVEAAGERTAPRGSSGFEIPEVALGERVARAGLEVPFETACLNSSFEREVQNELPGTVFGGMATLASVVFREAGSRIR